MYQIRSVRRLPHNWQRGSPWSFSLKISCCNIVYTNIRGFQVSIKSRQYFIFLFVLNTLLPRRTKKERFLHFSLRKSKRRIAVLNSYPPLFTAFFGYGGAGGGTRTHTGISPTDFESVTSANSITPAYYIIIHFFRANARFLFKNERVFERHRRFRPR